MNDQIPTPEESKGFLGALFDLSFSSFITTKIIKLLYLLAIVFSGLAAFSLIIKGFSNSLLLGLGALIISPLIFLLYICAVRIWMELVIVAFRIAEYVRSIDNKTPPSGPRPPMV